MARRASYRKHNGLLSPAVSKAVGALAIVMFALFFGLGVAQGANTQDDSTLGLGDIRSTLPESSAEQRETAQSLETAQPLEAPIVTESGTAVIHGQTVAVSSAESLATPQMRTYTVDNPGPGIVFNAVDAGDANTIAVAASMGTTSSLPDSLRLEADTSGEDWLTGVASAYDVASSSTLTYSGRAFDDDCVTVAVPQGMEEYVGRPVEIVWNGQVVIATVTDTGGFAKYGRCLDLGGGVWKAFGCKDCSDWGLQTIHYRFL